MNLNTEIRVTNLPAEVADRFGGNTAVVLDTPDEFSLRLSKDVQSLSVLGKIKTEGVLGFTLPFTSTNDAVFSEYATPLTLDNRKTVYTVQVTVDGKGIRFDRLQVKGKNDTSKEWELELLRSADHWVELAQQVKTNDLDFDIFTMSKTAIVANWDFPAYNGDFKTPSIGQRPYYWPVVDYGGWCDQTPVPQGAEGRFKAIGVEDFRPWLSFVYILRAGFCKFGWTIDSVLFDLDFVRRLWVYSLRPDYYIASKRGHRIIGREYVRYQWTQTGSTNFLRFTDLVQGVPGSFIPQGADRFCGIRNVTGIALKFRFYLKAIFHNDRPNTFNAFFSVMELEDVAGTFMYTGEVLSTESLQVDFAANEKKEVTFDQVVTLKPGQYAAIHIPVVPSTGLFVDPGLYFTVTPANEALSTGDIVTVNECISDEMSILDWTKAFIQLVNGRVETDWETKTITIYPNKTSNVFEETAPGFLLREDPIVDIEELVVKDSVRIKPVRPDLKRFTRFEFKKSTDSYIESLKLSAPAHSRTLLNSVDLPNEIESVPNPFIEPTLEAKPTLIGSGSGGRQPLPFLPRLWDNIEGRRSFNISPRILYAYDPVRQINPEPITATDLYTSFFFDVLPNGANTGLITEFGYATQLPTWDLTPTPTTIGNLVFGTSTPDLFTIFYLGYTQDARSGNLVDLLLRMKMVDYEKYNFRQFFRFRYRGIPIVAPMTSIRDFSSGQPGTPTPVQFFVEPAETECCDLPCGCQFSTCEYYQDMGVTMRQSTLNDILIASFEVDGIELLSSPLTLGLVNIIDIGGKPYVTNLVDTLNSVGAPYMAFSYSTREHPEKGKRFFKIKRLACVPFRILITVAGVDAYLYTHEEQKQAIFQVGFDDMGYGTEFIGVPENCEITTEY